MSSSIAAIHVAKKHLGLDDDTYRAKLKRLTGKTSVKEMSEAERQNVLLVFRQEGFEPASRRRPDGRQKLTGPYVKKLQALWIAGYNLGIVENRDDAALLAFVKRQTGIDHTRFLHEAADARKAIEALKSWLTREGGIRGDAGSGRWTTNGYDWLASDGAKVVWAQWCKLFPDATLLTRKGFDDAVRDVVGALFKNLSDLSPRDWQTVANSFGKRIRAAKKKGT